MSIKKLFKSHIPSINYVTQKGRTCSFVEGRYLTEHPEEIKELQDICESKSNPHLYIDPNETEVDTTVRERLQAVAQKAMLDELAQIEKEKQEANKPPQKPEPQATLPHAPTPVPGMSAAQLLGVANSATIGVPGKQSNSTPVQK